MRSLLRTHGVRPRKRWGQHFLCDRNALDKIVEAAALGSEDRVFEVGAGLGALTQRIAPRVREVIAVEIDPRLAPILREVLRGWTGVNIIRGDVLELDWASILPDSKVKTMGNLPYAITSPLLERLTRHRDRFAEAIWMVQREVAEKLLAQPGTRAASSLGTHVRAHFDVEKVAQVPKNAFFPRPEVDAVVLRLAPLARPRYQASSKQFKRAVRAAFGTRRKSLRRALTLAPDLPLTQAEADAVLERAGIDGARRGETLSIEELDRLARALEGIDKR